MNDAMVAGDDWDVVNSTGGSSSDSTGVIPDGVNATIFHTGGSKDDLDTAMPPETGCRTWTLSCAPSMSDPDPEDASFTDTATATGTPALGGSAVNDTSDPATCALCPEPTSSLQ